MYKRFMYSSQYIQSHEEPAHPCFEDCDGKFPKAMTIEGLDLHLGKDMEYFGIMFSKIRCYDCKSGAAIHF